jgi:hypothetical protein
MIENKFNNISLIVIVSFIESIGAYVYSVFLVAEVEVLFHDANMFVLPYLNLV